MIVPHLRVLCAAWAVASAMPASRAADLVLTPDGVACAVGSRGTIHLGIPALDGRGAHAAADPATIQTDGRELTAHFRAPFEDVALRMRLLDGDQVEYTYSALPADVRLVMCQFNLPDTSIEDGLSVTFDGARSFAIPAEPGKTNDDARIASLNAKGVEISWADGALLSLRSPFTCWYGIQDSRVWGKSFVGVCLTPPLKRDPQAPGRSTFVLSFAIGQPGTGASPSPADAIH